VKSGKKPMAQWNWEVQDISSRTNFRDSRRGMGLGSEMKLGAKLVRNLTKNIQDNLCVFSQMQK
jgi:hypothetical protein